MTLKGKTVILGITGSIAAVEDIKLARALRRKGAEVRAVMSRAACGIIHPDAVTYACDHPAITEITGLIEHVKYCGIGGSGDILLIAPATANTICKIAGGIDDTPVTTFATTAIGRGMPVVIVPAMHESMYRHPAVKESIEKLKSWGISFVEPKLEENKAKQASNDDIVLESERACGEKPLAGKRVLITSGACTEPLDDVRVLTTGSSGAMGREIALEAYRLGADVTIVHKNTAIPLINNIKTSDSDSMREAVLNYADDEFPDYYISAAAISDFAPEIYSGKIPSGEGVTITLLPKPKLLDGMLALKGKNPDAKIIAFKLGRDEEDKAKEMVKKGIFMVAVNTPDVMGSLSGRYRFVTESGITETEGQKEEIAKELWKAALQP
ncbi:bifunctional phosphopantothenoylcysteine decarboxylase/phosphopantothenate--cysteine ligase CoaBC [Methanoplanus endosymbiosus]|uniref:Coenzyme A biosynthesis bifunctional protein CoaBC n=1 Tax=Methanoplanus endosymbiosus TaxID=33865 RepID=A0A9E7PL06_9EURY|nr:bifunctional phosphopantothenoylcysteine decarboxylase/phosphopantothenate--cysteine ligase CoaBC [Methanoplanus endosymbiosus]UUX92104.1 bifunctional phosphopantothenoylcysteine decarboxylase/phosphopantothenate--cysteine ligase CoaBC [Methanoplanus endosymbiosus]